VPSTQTATIIKIYIITAITKAAIYTLITIILIITTRKNPRAVITIVEVVVTTYSIIRSALYAGSRATS
jgi:hypothetical protein